jgi:hypothetical protein
VVGGAYVKKCKLLSFVSDPLDFDCHFSPGTGPRCLYNKVRYF